VFLSVTLDFYTSDDVIHSVGMPVGSTPKCSVVVSLESAGSLVSSTNEFWLSKKKYIYFFSCEIYLNLKLGNRTIVVHGGWGGIGLDAVEDASEEILPFGRCSSAYIKLGAALVLEGFNVNFPLQSAMQLCASVVDTATDVV